MNRNIVWKVVLILAVLVVFTAAIIPTRNNPEPIKRGLDLKGGVQLSMRVNVNEAARLEVDQSMNSLRAQATAQKIPVPITSRQGDHTFVATLPPGVSSAAYERIAQDFLPTFEATRAGNALRFTMKQQAREALQRDTVDQAVEAIRRRVDALGVAEPIIVPEGI